MKLFVKIFLWFLVALGLMVGVVIFITRTFQTEPMFARWQRNAKTQMTIYGGTTTQIYNAEGEAGLRTYLARQKDSESIKEIGLVDINGKAAFGDASSMDTAELLKRAFESGTSEIDVSPEDAAYGAVPVSFSDGKKFVLVVRWSPPRTPNLFMDSWLGYLRLAGLLLTALIVCYIFARYLTSPIKKLRTATQKLAEGDLSSRVVPMVGRRRDELADLARDFDVMAERIETLVISQRRLNSDISHELRSPLARMNVALELAKQKSNKDTEPMLARIENESQRLNEMISRLLILAKLETNSELVEPVRIDLAEIVNDVAEDADFEAQAKGRSVTVSAEEHCTVMGSENLLRSAIENVLRNAVRYTAEGTAVDVSLKANNGHAVLQVSDHGGGVPDDELENLFRPFYRVGEDRTRKTGGIGLGLAIAERAILAHKGTISARNTDNGLLVEIRLDKDALSNS
ncbi:MAG TPA: ATP-binding protein [Pyrinomonadaceae bacterium]|nr:ATP-binding protein [Pyrinomonadaceae bacterium]